MTSQPAVVPPVWAARYKKEAHPQHRRWIKSHTAPVTRSNAGVGGAGTSRRQIPAKIWGNNCETVVTVSAAVEDGLEEQWRIVYDPDGAEKDRERGGLVLRCVLLFFVFFCSPISCCIQEYTTTRALPLFFPKRDCCGVCTNFCSQGMHAPFLCCTHFFPTFPNRDGSVNPGHFCFNPIPTYPLSPLSKIAPLRGSGAVRLGDCGEVRLRLRLWLRLFWKRNNP